jgi:hypothetical protein
MYCVSTPSESPKKSAFGLDCQIQTRSALAVPPDFSGLLHAAPCRFVAPYNRPWGSPCFQRRQIRRFANAFPSGVAPYEAFPSLSAEKSSLLVPTEAGSCVHRNLIPSRRCLRFLPELQSCCHVRNPGLCRSLDLRALSCQRVRCEAIVLPPLPARCSLGLFYLSRNDSVSYRGSGVGPPTPKGRRANSSP